MMKTSNEHLSPPRVAEWLLERCAPRGRTGETVVGDAREEFQEHLRSGSRVPAALWYWLHVLPIVLHGVLFGLGAAPGALPGAVAGAARGLRLAARTQLRRPGLALAVVATLAVGIGGNTVVFSIMDAVLFEPLPYDEPDDLAGVFRLSTSRWRGSPPAANVSGFFSVPPATFRDWEEATRSFTAMGAFEHWSFSWVSPNQPMRLSGVLATSGVFRALGVSPSLGRTFLPEEDRVGSPQVAVVSHGFWADGLGSDPSVLGRPLSLNGVPHTVVGVMPPGFSFPREGTQVWVTPPDARRGWPQRSGGFLQVVARLADGVTLEGAGREMAAVQARLADTHPDEGNRAARVYSLKELQVASTRPGIMLLLGATGLVLLIVCANTTNLLLVRALERDRELAIRTALGGGRRHLVAQLLSEGMALAAAGGALGCVLAALGIGSILSAIPVSIPNADAIGVDAGVAIFTAILAGGVGLLTGVVPALRVMRRDPGSVLREAGQARGGPTRNRTHAILAVVEVTLAFALLTAAGLVTESFRGMTAADPGFRAEGRLTMRVSLPGDYRSDGAATTRFFDQLTRRVADLPGVQAVGTASQMPFSGGISTPPASVEAAQGVVNTNIHNSAVTPGYFRAMGMRTVAGRLLDEHDGAGAPPVAVVNEALARLFWPDESPLGRRVRLDLPGDSVWRTVVGVVPDIRYGLSRNPFPEFYTTVAQRPLWYQTVVVHASSERADVAASMREAVWSLDSSIPVSVLSLDERIRRSRGFVFARFGSLSMGALAALAAFLAVVGVYGVVSFTVRARTHEFGVRMALGGSRPGVLRSVLARGLLLTGTGSAVGALAVLSLGRFLDPMLFQVSVRDPVTLGLMAILLCATGVGASVMPAFRATRVDPVRTLQAE